MVTYAVDHRIPLNFHTITVSSYAMYADDDSPAASGPSILSLSDLLSIAVPLIHEGARARHHTSDFIFDDPFYYFQLQSDSNHGPYIFYTTLPQALKILSPLLISRSSLFKRKVSNDLFLSSKLANNIPRLF